MISPQAIAGAANAGQADSADEIPLTLMPVLNRFAKEQLPVLVDTASILDERSDGIGTDEVPRFLGMHEVKIAGVSVQRIVIPYSLWIFHFWRSLEGEERVRATRLLEDMGAGDLFDIKQQVRLRRENNRLYLDPGQDVGCRAR